LQNLDEALRQLDQAEQSRQQLTPEQLQESLQEASERLQQSLEQVTEQRKQQLQEQLTDAADSVRDLSQQQQETSRQLRDALRKSMEARRENRYDSGLTPQEQDRLAEQKRGMQRQLEEIMQQTQETIDRFAEQSPETTDRLQQAIDELDKTKTAELLGISGDMIEEGQAPQAALRETRITEALNNLQNDLFETQDIAANETGVDTGDEITAADATSTLQQLRDSKSHSKASHRDNNRVVNKDSKAAPNKTPMQIKVVLWPVPGAQLKSTESGSESEENNRRIDANVRLLLRQIEQIELQIYREQQALSGVRNDRPASVPDGFDRRAADYFRRLSDEPRTGS